MTQNYKTPENCHPAALSECTGDLLSSSYLGTRLTDSSKETPSSFMKMTSCATQPSSSHITLHPTTAISLSYRTYGCGKTDQFPPIPFHHAATPFFRTRHGGPIYVSRGCDITSRKWSSAAADPSHWALGIPIIPDLHMEAPHALACYALRPPMVRCTTDIVS